MQSRVAMLIDMKMISVARLVDLFTGLYVAAVLSLTAAGLGGVFDNPDWPSALADLASPMALLVYPLRALGLLPETDAISASQVHAPTVLIYAGAGLAQAALMWALGRRMARSVPGRGTLPDLAARYTNGRVALGAAASYGLVTIAVGAFVVYSWAWDGAGSFAAIWLFPLIMPLGALVMWLDAPLLLLVGPIQAWLLWRLARGSVKRPGREPAGPL